MSPEINTALTLLAIGMITVFVVLLMVVITGKSLIRLVNRLSPSLKESSTEMTGTTLAAITAAVEDFTEGKGHIIKIEKE